MRIVDIHQKLRAKRWQCLRWDVCRWRDLRGQWSSALLYSERHSMPSRRYRDCRTSVFFPADLLFCGADRHFHSLVPFLARLPLSRNWLRRCKRGTNLFLPKETRTRLDIQLGLPPRRQTCARLASGALVELPLAIATQASGAKPFNMTTSFTTCRRLDFDDTSSLNSDLNNFIFMDLYLDVSRFLPSSLCLKHLLFTLALVYL